MESGAALIIGGDVSGAQEEERLGTIKKKQERGAFIPCAEQESMYNSKNL